jgi:hypothetical protein
LEAPMANQSNPPIIRNINFLREDYDRITGYFRYGMRTTHRLKDEMANGLMNKLALKVFFFFFFFFLFFSNFFLSANSPIKKVNVFEKFADGIAFEPGTWQVSSDTFAANYKALVLQLSNYQRRIVAKSGRTDAEPRAIYTGKVAGGADDLAMAFQLFFVGRQLYIENALVRYPNTDF